MDKGEPIFRLSHITKHFGSVAANEDISLEVYQGEILALLGENGSGKTTLMNMISGIYFPDRGQMYFKGKRAVFASPADALSKGIGMIHQHFRLVDVFSALENIVLGQDEGKLNLKMSSERIREICERYGFEVNLEKKVYDMSVSEKQTVEIVKALYRNAELLILDEPTAVLTPQEAEKLFCVLRSMREDGKAVIIITHKLQEVMELSDRFAIDTPGITTMVRRLSGGNVQKVLVGREISTAPAVLMTAYAVRGLDIHSSYTIYDLLNRQKESGVAVIYVGEDLDVLLELSDRVMVLCDGRVSGIVDARATSKQEVGCLMTRLGGNKNA